MGYLYKILPEVERFIVSFKRRFPDTSCRKIAIETSKKFNIRISKSSVNNVIKNENLSSSVGRRQKIVLNTDSSLDHGGAFLLRGIDCFLGVSKAASEVLLDIMPATYKIKLFHVENTFRCLVLYKLLFDTTIDIPMLYNNMEIWSLIGVRPAKKTYNLIVQMLNESQLFLEHLARELKQRLQAVAGFRFNLSDQRSFFVDAQGMGIWKVPIMNRSFYSTYCNSISYISEISDNNEPLFVFNILGNSIQCQEFLDLIAAFSSEETIRRLSSIELLNPENKTIENKFIHGSRVRFFLAGFWPWQLETMYELERKPARNRLTFRQLGLEYCYQIEEVNIIQPITLQLVKLSALLLRSTPSGIVKMGILSNIPKDIISNYLNINKLCHWILPEEKLNLFTQLNQKEVSTESFFDWFNQFDFDGGDGILLDKTIGLLSQIIFRFFQYELIPKECRQWNRLKVKDVFFRQKAEVADKKSMIIYNLFINKELCKNEYFVYLCQRMNNLNIKDAGKLMWFQVK